MGSVSLDVWGHVQWQGGALLSPCWLGWAVTSLCHLTSPCALC